MSNALFAFKQFSIRQDRSPMKINTDSVLIGAWADVKKARSILDIGTGTGIIALMLAQRSQAMIDAIDIDKDACMQAIDNFSRSKWKSRLKVIAAPLQEFSPQQKYDIIVSNPPYFPCPTSHKEKKGAQAKFTHKLSFSELADGIVRLLSPKGIFYVIFPVHEGAYFTNEAEKRKLFLTDYVWVKTTDKKKFPKRILMRFESRQRPINDDNILVVQNENGYTDEYKKLTREYYMKF